MKAEQGIRLSVVRIQAAGLRHSPEPFSKWAAAPFGVTQRTGPDRPKQLLIPRIIVPDIPPLEIMSCGHGGQ